MKYKKEIDYHCYEMSRMELAAAYGEGAGICAMAALLFYKSMIAFLCLLPMSYFYVKLVKKRKTAERKRKLGLEFLDGIKSVSAALNVGYSVENAFQEAYRDLSLVYSKDADIMREFYFIIRKIQMNCTAENALQDFARRSGVEDIKDFAEVFSTAKRTGGDIIKVIKNTCRVMEGRIEMQREIDISVAGKRYESGIMNLIPLGIIAYMWFFSADFMAPMYHNLFGISIMTVALLVYIMAWIISRKILEFE